jgi:putative membrane protein
VVVGIVASLQRAVFPALLVFFGTGLDGWSVLMAGFVFVMVIVAGAVGSYIGWRRLTYIVGENDIRVESGILSRAARSVPYERIQDVSLSEPLLARMFGLVEVKFETGAGESEDIALAFLTTEEGERLRQLVRERRDDETAPATHSDASEPASQPAKRSEENASTLFAMRPGRLFIFGLFEFSLAALAVLLGALQYGSSFTDLDPWDLDFWQERFGEQSEVITEMGRSAQFSLFLSAMFAIILLGLAAGLFRTFAREWDFLLERTARGFRRRRGLFTRTDVVMPVHRVQALEIGTKLIRYRFGWHSLSFVSLAGDNASSNHQVAPFAKMAEIAPIVAAAGFALPDDRADWQRASTAYRNDKALLDALLWLAITGVVAVFAPPGLFLIPLGIAVIMVAANLYAWEFRRHALDAKQLYAVRGVFAPQSQIATRLKLHSAEISQGPLGRLRGYATLNLGLAGGEFLIAGLPVERARELRRAVMETITATDFAHI